MSLFQAVFPNISFRMLSRTQQRDYAYRAAVDAVMAFKMLMRPENEMKLKVKAITVRGIPFSSLCTAHSGTEFVHVSLASHPEASAEENIKRQKDFDSIVLTALLGRKYGIPKFNAPTWSAQDEQKVLKMAQDLCEQPDDPSGQLMLQLHTARAKRLHKANRREILIVAERLLKKPSLDLQRLTYFVEHSARLLLEDEY